jgi:8-oxo-dGTP pyrophosphatase MutT (NUDIX family)
MSEGGPPPPTPPGGAPDPTAPAAELRVPTLEQIRAALSRHQPLRAPELGRAAAVLVPLLPRPDGVRLLFTKRSEALKTHGGQVSFPGGSVDATDKDRRETALREAREEVGLDAAHVEVLGELDDCPTFVSGFVITPVVGVIDPRHFRDGSYPWVPSAVEVDAIHELPLAGFCDPANLRIEEREDHGGLLRYQLYWFTVQGTVVWGATARILQGLIEMALGLPSTMPSRPR